MPSSQPFFSIVIPTLNEQNYLPQLLSDLSKQSFTDFEVIHVDGSSEDDTVNQAQSFSDKLSINTYQLDKRNVSYQRNFGATQAKADWIIFMDADNHLPTYFLLGIKYQLERNPAVDIFSCWMDIDSCQQSHKPLTALINVAIETSAAIKPIAPGSMIGVARKLFDEITFNTQLKAGEDLFFLSSAKKKGFKYICFKHPTYHYSFRRLEKMGILNSAIGCADVTLRSIFGGEKQIKKSKLYPMLGGSFYDQVDKVNFLSEIQQFLKNTTDKQKEKIKSLLNYLDIEA